MKLHPLSVPYRILQSAIGVFGLIVVLGIVVGQAEPGLASPVIAIGFIISVAAVIAWQVAYYRRFEYDLTSNTFDIASGVISRRIREIPYRRIQNVDISRTLVQRALGIAELRIETAGGTQSEAHLRYVGYQDAKHLQDEINTRTRGVASSTGENGPEPRERGTTLFQITDSELIILGIASFDLRVLSFVAVILSITAPSAIYVLLFELPVGPIVVLSAAAIVVFIISGILSGGSAIFNNFGFTLSQSGDELRYERGLLQRYDGSIPLDKVQTLILRENIIKRKFGYASLTLETAGYAPGQQAAESASVVPIARRDRTLSIAREIEPFDHIAFAHPARRARQRYTFQYLILASLLTIAAWAIVAYTVVDTWWYGVAITYVLAPIAAHLKWKHRGYAILENHVATRSGFWRRRTHIVPYYRIQTVDEVQTVLQRRWRISTVVIDTAGSSGIVEGNPTAYDLDEVEATDLRSALEQELQESLAARKQPTFEVSTLFPGGPLGVW